MQPISKETIEHADDFIFHLSDNQVKEFMDDLKKKQPVIHLSITSNLSNIIGIEGKILIPKIYLTVALCYKEYEIIIPPVSPDELRGCFTDLFKNIKFENDLVDYDKLFLQASEKINQVDLVNHCVKKIYENRELLKSTNAITASGYCIMCIASIGALSNKIKKLLPPSSI